jgi:hypothetical protein
MVAAFPSFYGDEESLPMQGICTWYCGRPARARWGQNNRSVAQLAEYFRGGARAIGSLSGKHWAIRCRATTLWSSYRHFSLEQRIRIDDAGVSRRRFIISWSHILNAPLHRRFLSCTVLFSFPLDSGYISPEAIVPLLSALSSLGTLYSTLNFNPLNLALTGKAEVCLHRNALSSTLSNNFISKA